MQVILGRGSGLLPCCTCTFVSTSCEPVSPWVLLHMVLGLAPHWGTVAGTGLRGVCARGVGVGFGMGDMLGCAAGTAGQWLSERSGRGGSGGYWGSGGAARLCVSSSLLNRQFGCGRLFLVPRRLPGLQGVLAPQIGFNGLPLAADSAG